MFWVWDGSEISSGEPNRAVGLLNLILWDVTEALGWKNQCLKRWLKLWGHIGHVCGLRRNKKEQKTASWGSSVFQSQAEEKKDCKGDRVLTKDKWNNEWADLGSKWHEKLHTFNGTSWLSCDFFRWPLYPKWVMETRMSPLTQVNLGLRFCQAETMRSNM